MDTIVCGIHRDSAFPLGIMLWKWDALLHSKLDICHIVFPAIQRMNNRQTLQHVAESGPMTGYREIFKKGEEGGKEQTGLKTCGPQNANPLVRQTQLGHLCNTHLLLQQWSFILAVAQVDVYGMISALMKETHMNFIWQQRDAIGNKSLSGKGKPNFCLCVADESWAGAKCNRHTMQWRTSQSDQACGTN